ncbi:MAG: PEP-CTERM sorting domain-containing protein [Burkholderiales bacterium]|nr:PEP-CTERM sorting domain-containing protein [Burkholderiales bacterium]
MTKFSFIKAVALSTLASACVAAHADTAIHASLDFDSVSSGTTANQYLAGLGLDTVMSFGNADRVDDAPIYDSIGNLLNDGAFHWVDASATYGNVLVKADSNAVSAHNVLWNDHAPILLTFAAPVNLASFSVQQDLSGFGNLQDMGSYLAFLDNTGHVISADNVYYTQGGNPGLTITSGAVTGVSGMLLSAGVHYDNLNINTVTAAVPEPDSMALVLSAMGLFGLLHSRRRKQD